MHIAVDLGAGSGRVYLVSFDPERLVLEELNRFSYPARDVDGYLKWDLEAIILGLEAGLQRAAAFSRDNGRAIESIGIDSWAVDYGWLDASDKLISDPICYRDERTEGVPEQVFRILSRKQIFEKTGIQIQRFNTLYQMYSEIPRPAEWKRFLLLPDLLAHWLTGTVCAEYTNATTTQMFNLTSGEWDPTLLRIAGIDNSAAPPITAAGTKLGMLRVDRGFAAELRSAVYVAPATHDTASAVAAAPLSDGVAYISSGTWSLVGIETTKPILGEQAADANFTNEGGAYGTFRFLKNVMGLWIFESCRKEWRDAGIETEYDTLINGISGDRISETLIYVDDKRFLNPKSMLVAIAQQLDETGQMMPDQPSALCKVIFDSLALSYSTVLSSIEVITNKPLTALEILGGGGRNRYLNQMTANIFGRPVRAGLVEATVIGNALVQAISLGRFRSLSEGREYLIERHDRQEFEPRPLANLAKARDDYQDLERWYALSEPA